MSFGKSTTTSTPQLTQEQRDQIAAQTGFFTETIAPTYKGAVENATNLYNKTAPGVLNASQNLASTASQAQKTLGETGESALRTGVTGLQSLFDPDYEANQISAALAPAQSMYEQNIANQRAQFGGTGNLGSARQALAGRQLAGSTMATQAATAAQVQKDIAAQRAATGANLAGIGQTSLGNAITAAGVPVSAAQMGLDYWNKALGGLYGVPQQATNPNFAGTQGSTTSGTQYGFKI